MTKKITEVTQMTGGSEGISLLIDSWRNQISQDQQYREFTQNSIESVKRVQKQNPEHKGIIKWEVDEPYFNQCKVKKGEKCNYTRMNPNRSYYIPNELSDTFFDYYPDLLDTFAQVCHAFDKNDYCLNMLNTPTMHKHYWNRGAEIGAWF